jgi:hypothetical protein
MPPSCGKLPHPPISLDSFPIFLFFFRTTTPGRIFSMRDQVPAPMTETRPRPLVHAKVEGSAQSNLAARQSPRTTRTSSPVLSYYLPLFAQVQCSERNKRRPAGGTSREGGRMMRASREEGDQTPSRALTMPYHPMAILFLSSFFLPVPLFSCMAHGRRYKPRLVQQVPRSPGRLDRTAKDGRLTHDGRFPRSIARGEAQDGWSRYAKHRPHSQ